MQSAVVTLKALFRPQKSYSHDGIRALGATAGFYNSSSELKNRRLCELILE
jgi:hypothetical protein